MFRILFAYTDFVSTAEKVRCSAAELRRELSMRSQKLAHAHPHERSIGSSFIFQDYEGLHGNFIAASYRAIQAAPDWAGRLNKSYTASRWVPRRWDRNRYELDCANSSDALLMNIFCYPNVLMGPALCALLGIEAGLRPDFGFKPRVPLIGKAKQLSDRTEIDMSLGSLLFEAKLTEADFQSAPLRLLDRYRDLNEVFERDELPMAGTSVQSYQLIRGVLAAEYLNRFFVVLCDARRADLIDQWYQVIRAVRHCDLRSRLMLLTWQEVSVTLPMELRTFLDDKYGICASG
jgi:hypothetical protein